MGFWQALNDYCEGEGFEVAERYRRTGSYGTKPDPLQELANFKTEIRRRAAAKELAALKEIHGDINA